MSRRTVRNRASRPAKNTESPRVPSFCSCSKRRRRNNRRLVTDFCHFSYRHTVVPGARQVLDMHLEAKLLAGRERFLVCVEDFLGGFLHWFPIVIRENHLHFGLTNGFVGHVLEERLDEPDFVAHKVFAGGDTEVRQLDAVLNGRDIGDFSQRGCCNPVLRRGDERPGQHQTDDHDDTSSNDDSGTTFAHVTSPGIFLMAAPCRACIRSAHLLLAAPCRACIRSAHLLLAAPCRACIRSAHAPLITMFPIFRVGAAIDPTKVTSLPIISIFFSIPRRFPAIVTSCTG